MTRLLERAMAEASRLTEKEQDALATWILEELESDRLWMKAFASSEDKLAKLAEEAIAEYQEGRTEELDPDRL